MSKSRVYICYWDCNGFEVIADCTSWERQSLMNTIAGKTLTPAPVNLQAMCMRARFNPQRNPEIWSFNTTEDIETDDLWQLADENPQALVDMIRDHGKKIYGLSLTTPARIQ